MKNKELKKIKKIIGVLSAIVQEHEGRETRVRWKDSIIRDEEETDTMSDKPAFTSVYERMAWDLENKSSDELRAELAEGKALGKKVSAAYEKLLKDLEEARTCPMARQRVGEGIEKAIKNSSVCLPRFS